MSSTSRHTLAAELLQRDAHAVRNSIATLRSVVQLTDDAELRDALATATSQLQIALECAVSAARIDTGRVPDPVQIGVITLIELARKRGSREAGDPIDIELVTSGDDVLVEVVAPLCERLLVDLMHIAGRSMAVAVTDTAVTIDIELAQPATDPIGYQAALAVASGVQLACTDTTARIDLVRSVS